MSGNNKHGGIPPSRWYTATEAACIIGKSTEWLRRKRVAGQVRCLPRQGVSREAWLFPEDEIERLRHELRRPVTISELCR